MNSPDRMDLPARRRRILFRATHRGTKEADILVGGFVSAHIISLQETALDMLEQILNIPDVDLADWLSGRRDIPASLIEAPMLRTMRDAVGRP
jgi:antitoxin CptB